ncbi:AAA family ATPase [Actinokineospora enzanensis]|uniref:AAA family ATPase n=1 Tax=Actinokineospora enzanensis TaxID=155975 RepID=UPI0003778463|nr:AAA family ATPase [Actinokineospora enzanensis]
MGAHIVTVVSGRGGCGKTTFAANLATVLADHHRGPVCLVDLDFTAGAVADQFDAEVDEGGVPDAGVATRLGRGLYAVLAPTVLGDPGRMPDRVVNELLAGLSTMYAYVVVDTPSTMNKHVMTALEYAHQQILVTTPERPALRGLRQLQDTLDTIDHDPALRTVVVNRAYPDSGMTADEIERGVRGPVAAWLPAAQEIPMSVNHGVPLVRVSPSHPYTRILRELARDHVDRP